MNVRSRSKPPAQCSTPRGSLVPAVALAVVAILSGCKSGLQNNLLGGAVAAGYFAQTPSNELEQTYYLGIFDPDEQVPQMMYRVTIRAQASAMNQMRYGSGWVPAWSIDSLGTKLTAGLDPSNDDVGIKFVGDSSDSDHKANLTIGRRLVMFGPDGFREAPKDHRLVIVMGASPEKFFEGIDAALGAVASAQLGTLAAPTQRDVTAADLAHRQRQIDLAKLGGGAGK